MKKRFSPCLLALLFLFITGACSTTGQMSIPLFTDRLNEISDKKTEPSDYIITDGEYKLLFEYEGFPVLLTAIASTNGAISKIRLSVAKTDEEGNSYKPDEQQYGFYKEKIIQAIYAFTLFDKEKSREAAEKILPLKSDGLSKTGELTMDVENYHIVYYSNKICCQLTVTDTYLEKTEVTEKPVSRPIRG